MLLLLAPSSQCARTLSNLMVPAVGRTMQRSRAADRGSIDVRAQLKQGAHGVEMVGATRVVQGREISGISSIDITSSIVSSVPAPVSHSHCLIGASDPASHEPIDDALDTRRISLASSVPNR